MMDFLHHLGIDKLLADLPHNSAALLHDVNFLIQGGAILVTGAAAFWLGLAVQPALRHSVERVLPSRWGPAFLRGCAPLMWPLFWLALLWPIQIVTGLSGEKIGLMDAATELLAAWICIRLLSLSVKSQAIAITLSLAVWSVVALSLFGVLDTVVHQLSVSALHVGKYRLSALTVVHAGLALCVLLWLTTLLFRFLSRQIEQAQSLTPSLKVLFIQLLQIFLPALAIVIALSASGVNLTALTVISGAVFLGIGLGLQKLVGNLVAGLTLLVGKSIKPGDVIAYKGGIGRVTEMGARYVTLRQLNGIEHLVPNEYFLETGIENWSYTDKRVGLSVPVGISYDADPRQAARLAEEAAKAVPRVLADPPPACLVTNFGDNAVELTVYVSIDDPENGTGTIKSEMLLNIWDKFRAAGIGFPYPQRDVHIISMPGNDGR